MSDLVEEKENEIKMEVEPVKPEESSIINLASVDSAILVKDQNYEFYYQRVYDPDKNKTPYFTLCYRESNQPWATVNGVLSDGYTIAKTEDIIKEIQENLKAEFLGEKHYRHKTAVKTIFMFKDYTLDIDTYSEVDKILFNLMTTIDLDEIQSRSGLAFTIVNGFSGNYALTLNYGFVTSLYGDSPTDKTRQVKLTVTNTFLLDEFSHRLVHDGKMEVSYATVSNVKAQVGNKIKEFKETPLTLEFMQGLERGFPKKFVKGFLKVYDELAEEFQNLYYASFIWSSFLETSKDLNKEIHLRRYVTAYLAERKLAAERAKANES
jgi:hypothetical protein